MKTELKLIAICHLLSAICLSASAQGTAFTYQGRLNDGTNAANGIYDLRFAIYDVLSGGGIIAGPITNSPTGVTNGLFTVILDFGADVFTNANRFLEIAVRTNGSGSFTTLNSRQKLTPAPYAIFAENVGVGGLTAGLYGNAVTFNNANNSFSGAFTGNGANVTNVNAATLNGLNAASFWQLGGNTVSSGQFLGTVNNQALDFYADGVRAMRLVLRTDAGGLYTNAPNVIGGSAVNQVSSGVVGGTVGGGGGNDTTGASYANMVTADFGTVSGGALNKAGGSFATVAGGAFNTASGDDATVGGGGNNTASGLGATVSGGQFNTASADHATVAGGGGTFGNTASGIGAMVAGGAGNTASGDFAAVSGGSGNTAGAIGSFIGGGGFDGTTTAGNLVNSKAATIGGGLGNHIPGGAEYACIGGGDFNTNSGTSGTLSGGEANTVTGNYATVPGGKGNLATGNYSFAAGHNAVANLAGCFVWEDDHDSSLVPAVTNFFLARCTGGAAFVTGVDSSGNATAGVIVHSGDTSWSILSDRNAKKNFQPVDGEAVLEKLAAIPVEQWNYKWEADTNTPHLGPMAQDFKAAFYPGRDDKVITTLEFDGVELAAIQGLNQKLDETRAELKRRDAENAELRQRLEALEKIIRDQKSN